MVSKYTEKNKFGNYTWKIKIDNLFHILIFGTENSSFLVEFKEWKWISSKTHFTYITHNNLEMTIKEVFEKVITFFENQNEYIWTENQKNQKLNLVLEEFQNLGDILNIVKTETLNFTSSSIKENSIKEAEAKKEPDYETNNYVKTPADEALDEASAYLMQGNLNLAINALERFTEIFGDNLSVLIMLARFKIVQKNKFEVKILVIKILAIMQQNIGLIPQMEMEEFDIVMEEFNKM